MIIFGGRELFDSFEDKELYKTIFDEEFIDYCSKTKLTLYNSSLDYLFSKYISKLTKSLYKKSFTLENDGFYSEIVLQIQQIYLLLGADDCYTREESCYVDVKIYRLKKFLESNDDFSLKYDIYKHFSGSIEKILEMRDYINNTARRTIEEALFWFNHNAKVLCKCYDIEVNQILEQFKNDIIKFIDSNERN